MRYEVHCRCGRPLAGERQAHHQVLPCPQCGQAVFVLPASAATAARQRGRRWWLAPLLAGAALLLVFAGAYASLIVYLGRPQVAGPAGPPDLGQEVDSGREPFAQGKFHLARQRFDSALALRERYPGQLTARQSRDLEQLHRQADLYARLLPVPLEEVVRQAKLVRDPDEWAMQFAAFRGGTVLLDDRVRRDPRGRPRLADHVLESGGEAVRLALEDLEVLRDLPLDDAPRLIFGGRIDACVREEDGWVIRFVADSGVLATDADGLAACLPYPTDERVEEVLARQRRWLEERAAVGPARP